MPTKFIIVQKKKKSYLSGNEIRSDGAAYISDALNTNRTLVHLYLGFKSDFVVLGYASHF